MSLPKFDSTPQTPAMMWRSTPKRLSACASACAPAAHRGAAFLDPLVVDEEAEIVPDRRLELGLVVHQLEDLHVGLHAGGDRVEGLARHALGGGLAAQAGEAGAEIGLRRGRRGGGDREPEKGEGDSGVHGVNIGRLWLTGLNEIFAPRSACLTRGGVRLSE